MNLNKLLLMSCPPKMTRKREEWNSKSINNVSHIIILIIIGLS